MVIIAIVICIIMFMLLVILHELGHFFAAKKSGVKVLEFGIGIPPNICKLWTDKSGTEYTLNAIPLGWFVRLKGEDPSNKKDFLAKDSFIKAKIWKKIIILLAGIGMNFITAWIIFSVLFSVGTKPFQVIPENSANSDTKSYMITTYSFLEEKGFLSGDYQNIPVQVEAVLNDSIASDIWLMSWDIITNINDEIVSTMNLSLLLKNHFWEEFTLWYTRNEQNYIGKWTCEIDSCILGVTYLQDNNLIIQDIKYPLWKAMVAGFVEIREQTKLTFKILGQIGNKLISLDKKQTTEALNSLSGPVAIVKIGEALISNGAWKMFFALAAMISLALAIFNVLPIPALDGGRLLGVLIQWITRAKEEKYFNIEGYVNTVFFVLLMALWVYIILKDLNVFWGLHLWG